MADKRPHDVYLKSGAVFLAAVALVLSFFFWKQNLDRNSREQLSQAIATQMAIRIQDFLGDRFRAVEQLAVLATSHDAVTEPWFRTRANAIHDTLPGFQALNWIDADGIIRWVTPHADNAGAVGARLFEHPIAGNFIRKAQTGDGTYATFPIPLLQGGKGFVAYRRIGDTRGYINVVFRLSDLMSRVFPASDDVVYALSLTDGDIELFSRMTANADWSNAADATVQVADRQWTLRLAPVVHFSLVDSALLLGGLFMAVVIFFAMRGLLLNQYRIVQNERRISEQAAQLRASSDALQTAHDDLELTVQTRTFELQNEVTARRQTEKDLKAAMAEAHKANKAKSEFLAHMSHELRTPLNSIIGFSDVWVNETFGKVENPRYKEYAEIINTSGRHLLHLVNDILDLSKVEAGEMHIEETPIQIDESIHAAASLLSPQTTEKDVHLDVRYVPYMPMIIHGDARLWTQVLLNIIGNAVKFTPPGGTVRIDAHTDEDGAIVITVKDPGPGIDADDLDRIMEPFGQARISSEISHEGTGLGLPLSRRFMELHGGTLTMHSTPGEGTTVTLTFPAERVQA